MCVDDYPFRHFSADRPKDCRKFVFVNEEEFAKTYYINISQFEQFGDIALCKILLYLSNKGLVISNKKFFLPKFNAIIEPFTFCRILYDALDEKQVFLKVYPIQKSSEEIFEEDEDQCHEYKSNPKDQNNYFCRIEDVQAGQINDIFNLNKDKEEEEYVLLNSIDLEEEKSGSEKMIDQAEFISHDKSEDHHKKPKEAERVIGQVISAVKIWRGLYQSKRCNLTNAAKVVGISKKSLDDYYLVLRVGEIFRFDYTTNLNNLMGDLRNYIRAQQQKVTGKLGKKVKCFDLVEDIDLDKRMVDFKLNSQAMKE